MVPDFPWDLTHAKKTLALIFRHINYDKTVCNCPGQGMSANPGQGNIHGKIRGVRKNTAKMRRLHEEGLGGRQSSRKYHSCIMTLFSCMLNE